MTTNKETLAYITNDAERKELFKKRKKEVIKKVSEISTVCGVEACAIIYSPYDPEPEVWPSWLRAQAVLNRFRRLPEMDRARKMVNQESFTRQRIKKTHDRPRHIHDESKEKEIKSFMFKCLAGTASMEHFDMRNSVEMNRVINETLRDIKSRLDAMKISGQAAST